MGLDKVRIATEKAGPNYFGVLLDENRYLLASAFARNLNTVSSYLREYSRSITSELPVSIDSNLLRGMFRLFEGKAIPIQYKFNTEHISRYQSRVSDILSEIPHGKVTTYGLIAKRLHSGPRAVGNAVGSNPWPLFVPCHRVVPSTLSIGNYSMCGRLGENGSVKRELLEKESVPFEHDVIPTQAVWTPGR